MSRVRPWRSRASYGRLSWMSSFCRSWSNNAEVLGLSTTSAIHHPLSCLTSRAYCTRGSTAYVSMESGIALLAAKVTLEYEYLPLGANSQGHRCKKGDGEGPSALWVG